ncbi:hypothetical protein D3C80_2023550 [compost metagenome]
MTGSKAARQQGSTELLPHVRGGGEPVRIARGSFEAETDLSLERKPRIGEAASRF